MMASSEEFWEEKNKDEDSEYEKERHWYKKKVEFLNFLGGVMWQLKIISSLYFSIATFSF